MTRAIQSILAQDKAALEAALNLDAGSARIEVQCLLQAVLQVDRAGLDCSAFTQLAYSQVLGFTLPRTTESQASLGRPVDRYRLQHGDLVFFKTGWQQYHVGVYTGAGEFIHASTSKGVIRSRLDNVYWNSRYWQARRLTQ